MNFKFESPTRVKITAKMNHPRQRPALKDRKFVYRSKILDEFLAECPGYEIISVSGPPEICNFRGPEESVGEWLVEVQHKAKKKVPKPTAKPKLPPQPKAPKPTASTKKKKSYSSKSSKEGV